MARTDSFKEQHKKLMQLVGDIGSKLVAETLRKDPSEVVMLLAKLSGTIKVHLSMEDQVLYPAMLNSADEGLKQVASKYSKEMSGISNAYSAFSSKWLTNQIKENPEDFVKEMKDIITVLGKRIAAEEKELYPLADKVLS